MQDGRFLNLQVFSGKLCHDVTLIGINEAGAENERFRLAVFLQRNARRRCAGSDQRNLVRRQHRFFRSHAAAGSRTDYSDNFILGHQFRSRVAGFRRLGLVVRGHYFNLLAVDAAGLVGFLYRQFKTGEHALAVVGNVAGQFGIYAYYNFLACVSRFFFAAAATAACSQARSQHSCQRNA